MEAKISEIKQKLEFSKSNSKNESELLHNEIDRLLDLNEKFLKDINHNNEFIEAKKKENNGLINELNQSEHKYSCCEKELKVSTNNYFLYFNFELKNSR